MPEREAIRDYELGMQPEEDVDFEFMSPNHLVGPNIGLIPLLNAFQPTRAFYGARFANQAQPLAKPETPWVQTSIDETPDISFDDSLGGIAGAVHADEDGVVDHVTPQQIHLSTAAGKKIIDLHDHTPFNRYSGITQTPVVTKGQTIKAKDLLARSNFTDDKGALALGLNAVIGVVPFKGHSMDDAMVVSRSFANRATSQHLDTVDKDFSGGTFRGGQDHYKSLFPNTFTKDQLALLDEHGVVKPGQTVQPGDPLILATKPRNFNSAQTASLGRLGKVARQQRADASTTWDSKFPGRVTDVVRQKDGTTKVMVESNRPMELGDKCVIRSGQKGILSKIIPDHEMPRTASGQQLDMLLNQQGIPSRANPSLILELMLGKLAAKQGKPIKLPAFNKEGDNWVQHVRDQLKLAGLTDKETVFDPSENRKLDNPITVGNAYVLKLHHVSEHKVSARGQGSYDSDLQPSKGGDTGAKRRSGLESAAMLSSGAYNNLRESATLTGAQNDDFWRSFRSGQPVQAPGQPFVFKKFRALLNGAGLHANDHGNGQLRLGLLTDRLFDKYNPLPVHSGETVDFRTLQPKHGGLFDPALTAGHRWGALDLPEPLPNPAAEATLRTLLGNLTQKDFEAVLAGQKHL